MLNTQFWHGETSKFYHFIRMIETKLWNVNNEIKINNPNYHVNDAMAKLGE